jgi:hypothetical protein
MAYHFAGMGQAAAEAEFFRSVAGGWARMLDFETSTDWGWARTFLSNLEASASNSLTYGSASSLSQGYAQIPSMIMVAAYGQGYPGFGVIWQFTDAAQIPGIVGNVDESSWHGTEMQYDLLFEVTAVAPPPAPPKIYPGDNVQAVNTTVTIGANGKGWVPSPVPAAKVVSCPIADENPDVVGRYDNVPTWVGTATQPGPSSPNGALTFEGTPGTYGITIWSVS